MPNLFRNRLKSINPPSILATRRFKTNFFQCISRHPIKLHIVSPFIGRIPAFGTIVNFARIYLQESDKELLLITRPPGRSEDLLSNEEAEALCNLGVDLRIRSSPPLHSKIYQFEFPEGDRTAFVGSANFTLGGFKRNDETIAIFRDSLLNDKVKSEISRLANFGTVPFHHWKLSSINK